MGYVVFHRRHPHHSQTTLPAPQEACTGCAARSTCNRKKPVRQLEDDGRWASGSSVAEHAGHGGRFDSFPAAATRAESLQANNAAVLVAVL